jgi:hypothetical protein
MQAYAATGLSAGRVWIDIGAIQSLIHPGAIGEARTE